MAATRSQGWIFTHNNYTDADITHYDSVKVQYIVYGKEVAPTTGTPHLQGYVYFASKKSFKQVSKMFPGAHIEKAKCNDANDQFNYTTKSGDFKERGEAPKTSKQKGESAIAKWDNVRKLARECRYDEIPSDIYMRCMNNIKRCRYDKIPPNPSKIEHNGPWSLWIYGPGGTGKTWFVEQHYQPLYRKSHDQWWDNYAGEPVVLLDEFCVRDLAHIGKSVFKKWTDRYPFQAPVKGGYICIRPQMFIVTSNFRLDDIVLDEQDNEAIRRRFREVEFLVRDDNRVKINL